MPENGHSGHKGPSGIVRPYGDTTGDGMVQTSFTLPVPPGPKADGAALQLAQKMGIEPAMVVHSHGIGGGGGPAADGAAFTFFVVYGSVRHLVDLDAVQIEERAYPLLSPSEVNLAIRAGLARKMGGEAAMVDHSKPIGPSFPFFVVYGPVSHLVDLDAVKVVEREYPLLAPKETNLAIRTLLRRRMVVVGA